MSDHIYIYIYIYECWIGFIAEILVYEHKILKTLNNMWWGIKLLYNTWNTEFVFSRFISYCKIIDVHLYLVSCIQYNMTYSKIISIRFVMKLCTFIFRNYIKRNKLQTSIELLLKFWFEDVKSIPYVDN